MLSLKKTISLILIGALCNISGATYYAEAAQTREIEAFNDDINVVARRKDEDRIATKGTCDSMSEYVKARKYFSMREPVPPERIREIRTNLGHHQAHISAMITAHKGLTTTFKEFEHKLSYVLKGLKKHGELERISMHDTYFLESLRENHALIGRLADYWVIQWGARDSHVTASASRGEPRQNPSRYWVPPLKTSFRSFPKSDSNFDVKSSVPNKFTDAMKSIMDRIVNSSIYRLWERVLDKPEKMLFKHSNFDHGKEERSPLPISVGNQEDTETIPPYIQKSFSKNKLPITNTTPQQCEENDEKVPRDVMLIVIDKIIYNRVQVLNEIFNHSQELLMSSDVSAKARYQVQLCGQKYILQAIQYMFKFQMISNEHLEFFFQKPGAVELTARHIFQLFHMYSYGFSKNQTFVPELNFISNHGFISHLHVIIKALDKKTQGHILKNTLWYTVDRFDRAFPRVRTPKSREINALFFHKEFQDQLKSWPNIPTGVDENTIDHYFYMRMVLQKTVNYYQRPPTVSPTNEEIKKAEYLIVHYFISYIDNYHENVNLREVLQSDELMNYEIFKKQFNLMEDGLAYHQRRILISSFSNLFKENDKRRSIQKTICKDDLRIEKLNELSQSFKAGLMELIQISRTNQDLKTWLFGNQLNDAGRAQNVSSEMIDILRHEMDKPLSSLINEGRNLWMAKGQTLLWCDSYNHDIWHELLLININKDEKMSHFEVRPI